MEFITPSSGRVGIVARHSTAAHEDVRLHAAGPVHEVDRQSLRRLGGGGKFAPAWLPRWRGFPLGERFFDQRHDVRRLHVADDGEGRVVRREMRLVELHQVFAPDAAHALPRSDKRRRDCSAP